jgi:hypothetical protein
LTETAKVVPIHEARVSRAEAVARAILAGFDRHYRLFREASARAKTLFERADWPALHALARERIQMYDQRVQEAVDEVLTRFPKQGLGGVVRRAATACCRIPQGCATTARRFAIAPRLGATTALPPLRVWT